MSSFAPRLAAVRPLKGFVTLPLLVPVIPQKAGDDLSWSARAIAHLSPDGGQRRFSTLVSEPLTAIQVHYTVEVQIRKLHQCSQPGVNWTPSESSSGHWAAIPCSAPSRWSKLCTFGCEEGQLADKAIGFQFRLLPPAIESTALVTEEAYCQLVVRIMVAPAWYAGFTVQAFQQNGAKMDLQLTAFTVFLDFEELIHSHEYVQ
ncbi:hypothetical protein NMY22_g5238 [Coprinellus aureogranulatus]|nr:hypothetical protein NMY22_g5238 [Coprinellus aureogranulatus]